MTALSVLDTGLAGARRNVAVTAALLELHAAGRIGDTLRLHRYRASVLLGRSQPPGGAFDRDACARRGAEIARRVTGGGAVAMTPGALAWDLVTARRPGQSLDAIAALLCRALAGALAGYGVQAAFRPPGDVIAAGRKIAGTAGVFEGGTILHQGSLLIDADTAEMAELLGVPRLPVATLAELTGAVPARLSETVAAALAGALGLAPVRGAPGPELERAAGAFLDAEAILA